MSKREIVLLVSRAIAVIQWITALMYLLYLPQYLMNLLHHITPTQPTDLFWNRYYFEGLFAEILRVAVLAGIAGWFWKCGPGVERILLPLIPESGASSTATDPPNS
ncbi:MAG: hypothetical protein WA294_17055 [Acidobacteriaceae bacterium]